MRHIALAGSIAALTAVAAQAHATANCGTFRSDGAAVHAKVTRGSASCKTARVLRSYFDSTAPCSGSACVRSHFGWTCATATPSAVPRLASCIRGRAVIAAYSTAD
jgi:hypothetical protein